MTKYRGSYSYRSYSGSSGSGSGYGSGSGSFPPFIIFIIVVIVILYILSKCVNLCDKEEETKKNDESEWEDCPSSEEEEKPVELIKRTSSAPEISTKSATVVDIPHVPSTPLPPPFPSIFNKSEDYSSSGDNNRTSRAPTSSATVVDISYAPYSPLLPPSAPPPPPPPGFYEFVKQNNNIESTGKSVGYGWAL